MPQPARTERHSAVAELEDPALWVCPDDDEDILDLGLLIGQQQANKVSQASAGTDRTSPDSADSNYNDEDMDSSVGRRSFWPQDPFSDDPTLRALCAAARKKVLAGDGKGKDGRNPAGHGGVALFDGLPVGMEDQPVGKGAAGQSSSRT